MKREAKLKSRKKPGPPPTGRGYLVGVRLQPPELTSIDQWRKTGGVTRPEAIRRLIELGLKKESV